MAQPAFPLTRALADWAAAFSLDTAPPGVAEKARIAIVDTIGVILAGIDKEAPRILRRLAAGDAAAPAATVLGTSLRSSAEIAAEINGTAGHVLDYDDVSRTGFSHSSTVILPAVLALAEAGGASGRRLVEAFVVGIEVLARLGMATGLPHYSRGWHSTSTLGTPAAAAACARLLGLDGEATARAIGIAFSQAAGTRRNFGTMTKSFHAGHAARCGLHAARLAAAGFEASRDAVEGPAGLVDLYGGTDTPHADIAASLGSTYELLSPGLNQKKYPCCFATHRAIDSVLDLTATHAIDWRAVEHVEVKVPPQGATSLIRGWPTSPLMAKFSMPFVVAAALIDGDVRMDHFTAAALARADIGALMPRVAMGENPELPVFQFPVEQGYVEVAAVMADGRRLVIRTENPRGSPERPLALAEIVEKFKSCAAMRLAAPRVDQLVALLFSLDTLPEVTGIAELLRPESGAPHPSGGPPIRA